MHSEAIIHVLNLCKVFRVLKRKPGFLGGLRTLFSTDYEEVRAVHDVSFEIAPGELVGYIGPNGAGKSTTIKMPTGILLSVERRCLGRRPDAASRACPQRQADRRDLWPAQPVIMGYPAARLVRSHAPHVRGSTRPLPCESEAVHRAARPGRAVGSPGAIAFPGAAHALRAGGLAAARSQSRVPGRAHDRERRPEVSKSSFTSSSKTSRSSLMS